MDWPGEPTRRDGCKACVSCGRDLCAEKSQAVTQTEGPSPGNWKRNAQRERRRAGEQMVVVGGAGLGNPYVFCTRISFSSFLFFWAPFPTLEQCFCFNARRNEKGSGLLVGAPRYCMPEGRFAARDPCPPAESVSRLNQKA